MLSRLSFRFPSRLGPRLSALRRPGPVAVFAAATLAPVPFLALGAVFGGAWLWIALLYLAVFLLALDELARAAAPSLPEAQEFPAADRLSVALAVAHFALLPLGVWALTGRSGLSAGEALVAFFAFGLYFGQVSNANAHELIHRADRRLFALGMWVYISLLFGHHTSAHRHIHHRFVATPDDPNTAEAGESFYDFFARAWPGSFVAGYEIERELMARTPGRFRPHPYAVYLGGGAAMLAGMTWAFGLTGLIAYLLLCFHAQVQLLLTDYVQHYGLTRATLPGGKAAPVGPEHSWDAPHPFTGFLTLNAPRHADHHAHPARPYPALRIDAGGSSPLLPHPLPAMAALALWPGRWRRVMDRRLAEWKAGRESPASG